MENLAAEAPYTLRVVQRSSPFNWGTVVRVDQAASRSPAEDGRFVATDPYHLHFLVVNSVTPGNAGKWKLWERPVYRRNYLRFAGALDSLGLRNRGHIEDNVRAPAELNVYELDLINELVLVPDLTRDVKGLNRDERILEHTQWY